MNGRFVSPSSTRSFAPKLVFPSDHYPETAKHIREAIAAGASSVCTIDRDGADENRKLSLSGIPTKKGYDRDEWPIFWSKRRQLAARIQHHFVVLGR